MAKKNTSTTAQSTSTTQDRIRSSAQSEIARQDVNGPKGTLIARSEATSVLKHKVRKRLTHHASRTEIQLIVFGSDRLEIHLVMDPRPKHEIGKASEKIGEEPVSELYDQPIKLSRWTRLGQWFKKVGSGVWNQVCKQAPAVLGWLILGLFRK